MAAAQGGGQGQSDDSMGIIWTIVALFAFFAGIWYFAKRQIVEFYFKLKLWEMDVIGLFTHDLDHVRENMMSADPTQFTFDQVMQLGQSVGAYLRIPFVLIIIFFAGAIYLANSTRVFKRVYDMVALADVEKVNWPQITPVMGKNLVKMDIDKGPWAMAMTPMQFCKHHKLLEEHQPQPREGVARKEWNRIEVTLRRGQSNKVFALQLGALWPGVEKLPLHMRALFGIFAAKNAGDSKVAADALAKISASSATKLDFSGADVLYKKYIDTKPIQKVLNQHGYILTVMASMLVAAREDGVQASADFLWLKPVDRRLWYMLNTAGRQTPFVEVAGPFAHWIAEKQIEKRLLVPMVEEATNALEIVLKEVIYHPDEKD